MKRSTFTINLGGLDERHTAPEGRAGAALNVSRTADGWQSAPGVEHVLDLDAPGVVLYGAIVRGRPALLVETGTVGARDGAVSAVNWNLYGVVALDELDGGRLVGAPPLTRSRFALHAGWVYAANGTNRPWRWNGRYVRSVGFTQPPMPPAVYRAAETFDHTVLVASALSGGPHQRGLGERPSTSEDAPWRYGWRCTYVNDLGSESPPSGWAWVTGYNPGGVKMKFSVLLQSVVPPAGVREVRFYRTRNLYGVAGGQDLEFPAYLARRVQPAEAVAVVDDVPDELLGELLRDDELGAVPSGVIAFQPFAGRMLAITKDGLYASTPLRFEQFSERVEVGTDFGGRFVGLIPTRSSIVVLRERGCYALTSESGEIVSTTLSENLSGVGQGVEVPGYGPVFLAADGPYRVVYADEYAPPVTIEWLGAELRSTWRRVEVNALAMTQVAVCRREREVWFLVPRRGSSVPSLGLVLHYSGDPAWSVRDGYDARAIAETPDGEVFVAGVDALYRVTRAAAQELDCTYQTTPFQVAARGQMLSAELLVADRGSQPVSVSRHEDRRLSSADSVNALQRDPSRAARPVWGVALWGSGSWTEERAIRFRVDSAGSRSSEYAVAVTGHRFELVGLAVTFDTAGGDPGVLSGGRS